MNDFRLDIKIRNNRLISLIEEGYRNVSDFSKKNGINESIVGQYANLKESPTRTTSDGVILWKKTAICVSEALGVLPEEIWPDHMQDIKLNNNKTNMTLSVTDAQALLTGERQAIDPMLECLEEDRLSGIEAALASLNPRERQIISERFGFNGLEPKSIAVLAKDYDVSPTRISQIEYRAFRKLRHPSRGLANLMKETT